MKKNIISLLLVLIFISFLSYGFFQASSASLKDNVGEFYVERGVEDTGAINLVAAILFDYRAFDTLGEATVIYTAVSLVMSIAPFLGASLTRTELNPLAGRSMGLALPLLMISALYIVFYGHLFPGGGFPGGVIFAAGAAAFGLTYGLPSLKHKLEPHSLHLLDETGAGALIVLGLTGIMAGNNFLASGQAGIYLGEPGELLSSGLIPLFNLAIAVKVGTGLTLVFLSFARGDR